MSYHDYRTEDFVLDPNFRKWVLGEDKSANEFWANWISENPDKLDTIKEARRMVLNIGEIKYTLPENKVDSIWRVVEKHVDREQSEKAKETKMVSISPEAVIYSSEKKLNRHNNRLSGYWWRVAAVFAMALGVSYFFLRNEFDKPSEIQQSQEIVKSNPWGQKSTVYLNDGSEVVLNSGSKLTYSNDFGVANRNIRLLGEAYFKVKRNEKLPFVVQSSGVETTALGTEFNVRAYEDELVSVALTKGKVKVISEAGADFSKGESVILSPGEGVKYTEDKTLSKFSFDSKEYTGWVSGTLYFQNATEQEVFKKLEKWYGVSVQVTNNSPRKWGYTGEFEKKSLESVLMSMGFAMDFSFEIKNDTVLLKYNAYANDRR